MAHVNVREVGAKGDGQADDSAALQRAIDEVHRAGGGRVVVGAGVYRAAGLELRSGVEFHLEHGARVRGLDGMEAYERRGFAVGLFYTLDAERVAITGTGVLDGNGLAFFDSGRRFDSKDYDTAFTRQGGQFKRLEDHVEDGPWLYDKRPNNMIIFARCRHVEISGVTLTNPAAWCLHLGDCESARVTRLRVENQQPVPNNDGIHCTNCRDVMITDSFFDCGDDCIAITGVRHEPHFGEAFVSARGATENIVISHCVLRSRSSALRIGWGPNPVRSVVAGNLLIPDSNRGINICSRGGGGVEDVLLHDIIVSSRIRHGHWWGLGEAVHVSSAPLRFAGDDPERPGKAGVIRRVRLSNVEAEADSGILAFAHHPGDIREIALDRVRLRLRRGELEDLYGGNLDLRATDLPERQIFVSDRGALHFHGVHGARLDDVVVHVAENMPDYYRGRLLMTECRGIETRNCEV